MKKKKEFTLNNPRRLPVGRRPLLSRCVDTVRGGSLGCRGGRTSHRTLETEKKQQQKQPHTCKINITEKFLETNIIITFLFWVKASFALKKDRIFYFAYSMMFRFLEGSLFFK